MFEARISLLACLPGLLAGLLLRPARTH